MPRRVLEGKVVSDKMDKSVTVLVTRQFMHPLYKKFVRKTKKYTAHDESNSVKSGDIVQIEECKPISKTKSWKVITASDTRAQFEEDKKETGTKKNKKSTKAKSKASSAKKKSSAKKETSKTKKAKDSKAKKSKNKKSTAKKSAKTKSSKKKTAKKSTSKKKDEKK